MATGGRDRFASRRCLWLRVPALALPLAILAGCSGGDASPGDLAPCAAGAAACGTAAAAAAGGSGVAAGGGGIGAGSGPGGAGGMQVIAGSGGGGVAGAAAGAGGGSGAAGGAGSAGNSADAGAEPDAAAAGAGGSGGMDAATPDDAGADAPPYTPVLRVQARIHAADSALTDEEFTAITAEVNLIWRSQAGVCFEFDLVDDDQLGPGLDIRYGPGTASDPNGYYSGDNDIFSRDQPSLGPAPHPVQITTARTTAHEFGHALGLQHQDFESACPDGTGDLDCDDLLMRSGRRGFFLSESEIERARSVAENKALDDTTPLDCDPLVIMR